LRCRFEQKLDHGPGEAEIVLSRFKVSQRAFDESVMYGSSTGEPHISTALEHGIAASVPRKITKRVPAGLKKAE
jgi:hypothetical protein